MRPRKLTILSILVLAVSLSSTSILPSIKAQASPSPQTEPSSIGLDGIAKAANCTSPAFSYCRSGLLTTTRSNDVIIVLLKCTAATCNAENTTVTDTSGLTFTRRISFGMGTNPAGNISLLEFYAIADSPLDSDNITAAPFSTYGVFPVILAVRGVDTHIIFDPNPSLPAVCMPPGSHNGGWDQCTTHFLTTGNDLIIVNMAINDDAPCIVPQGFVNITAGGYQEVDYRIADRSENSFSFTCTGTNPEAITIDALIAYAPQTHTPILIDGNDGFTNDNGVRAGTGTSDDPYMITGWNISNPAPGNGITIRNTDAYFIVSSISIIWNPPNCFETPSCWQHPPNGILLDNVEHGAIMDSKVLLISGRFALNVTLSDNIRVSNNDLRIGFNSVVFLKWSSSIDIRDNIIFGGAGTIEGHYLEDVTITGNSGGAESGISLFHVGSAFISQNNIRAHDPFFVDDCTFVTIDNNIASAHDNGISISNCGSFEIEGNTVQGTSVRADRAGISVTNTANFAISANNVTNFNVGLNLVSTSEFSIASFQCTGCTTGILVNGAEAGLIENSQVSGAYYGLRMDSSDNILVQNNRLRADGWGLILKDSSSIELTNNEMSGGSGNMFRGENLSQVTIRDNYGTAEEGVNLVNVRNVSILNNRFNADHDGLIVRGCSDVTVMGNHATGVNTHIGLEDCTNGSISQNIESLRYTGEKPDAGISLIRSTGISISDNQVVNDRVGILLRFNSTGNSVNDNVISNNTCGIQTDQSTVDQNDLSNNTFQVNTQDYCSA